MIVFRANDDITTSLSRLVQCWIVAERLNYRLLIQWDNLPTGKIALNNFFDLSKNEAKSVIEYDTLKYPVETNKYLIRYYYQRVFTQILHIRSRPSMSMALCHIALWGDDAITHQASVNARYPFKSKRSYSFTNTELAETWNNLIFLSHCDVIAGPESPFLEIALRIGKRKEQLLVAGKSLTFIRP